MQAAELVTIVDMAPAQASLNEHSADFSNVVLLMSKESNILVEKETVLN